jgi:hypothetical protein
LPDKTDTLKLESTQNSYGLTRGACYYGGKKA